jgi:hypothetical protein
MDFPAPVSPVMVVKPVSGSSSSDEINAKFFTTNFFNMAKKLSSA